MRNTLISYEEACRILDDNIIAKPAQRRSLEESLGHRLASPIIAGLTQPPFDVSAMDGYAVHFSDVERNSALLTIVGEVAAGQRVKTPLQPGQAVRISTGGYIPEGADHVVIQEHTIQEGSQIRIGQKQKTARNIRRAGLDFKTGELLVAEGRVLGPAEIAIAAASNHADLNVFQKPEVAIIASGSELAAPGSELETGQIVSSNPFALAALFERLGANVSLTGIATDDQQSISAHIETALKADFIVPVGGASVGKHDLMRATFAQQGLNLLFEGVAIRPGKPSWFGRLAAKPVLGLPGNPLAAFVCGLLFGSRLIGAADHIQPSLARLTEPLQDAGDKDLFALGWLDAAAGELTVTPSVNTDTSRLRTLLSSNCLIHRPGGSPAPEVGQLVQVVQLP